MLSSSARSVPRVDISFHGSEEARKLPLIPHYLFYIVVTGLQVQTDDDAASVVHPSPSISGKRRNMRKKTCVSFCCSKFCGILHVWKDSMAKHSTEAELLKNSFRAVIVGNPSSVRSVSPGKWQLGSGNHPG